MDNAFFLFAPDKGYFYNCTAKYQWRIKDEGLDAWIVKKVVSKWLWGAYGPGDENYLFTYLDTNGKAHGWMGDGVPQKLKDWLKKNLVNEHTRFSLGPDSSFFVWDHKSIAWHGIPDGLQDSILSWLGPAGWTHGPPRIVTLGTQGSYFAISEYGKTAWFVPRGLPENTKCWKELKDEFTAGTFKYTDLEYVNFSSCDDDYLVYVKKGSSFGGYLPEPHEAFYSCIETMLDESVAAAWRKQRETKNKEKEAKEAEEQEQQRKKAEVEEKARREEEERNAEMLTLAYVLWQSAWEADVTRKKILTTFPHLPAQVCICGDISCKNRKVDSGLLACQHDVERFLRASGLYTLAWLRKERLPWHPDRFGQRCDPDFRKELKKKATEMYAIFETLIEEEKTRSEES